MKILSIAEWALTNVGDQICCDEPAARCIIIKLICDRHSGCTNDSNFKIDEKNAQEESACTGMVRQDYKGQGQIDGRSVYLTLL